MAVETKQFLRLENARIVTGENLKVIENGAIVISDDRIAWVGDAREIPKEFQFADQIVDLDRRTVIPGLVDTHMHISFGEAQSEEELSIHTPMAYRAIRASVDAQKVIRAGVTSACDPGGPIGIATAVRDAIDAGLVVGPRMAAAGRQITTQLGVGDTLPEPLGDLPTSFGALVRSKNEIVQEIRNEVKAGVDLIKLAGSGPGTEEFGAFDFEELCVAVAEAHRLGKPIAIHARSRQSIADAVNANFDWIMHASFMDDRTLDELITKKIPIVPAMTLLVNLIECGQGVMPPKILDGIKRELDSAVAVLSKAHRAGAILIAGSESGFAMTPYGEWHTREMELFVELLGFSNFDALLSMTKVASLAIPRFGHLIGTLSQGKYADLVVVDGRPDEDVKLLGRKKNLYAVMKGGKLIDISHEELARETYLFERTRLYTNGKFRRNDSQ
jgi:imidazolonepropionase-like amidohydrolase